VLGNCYIHSDLIAGMSQEHHRKLRLKRTDLLESVLVNEQLLAKLESDWIIDQSVREDIKVTNTLAAFLIVIRLHLCGKKHNLQRIAPNLVWPVYIVFVYVCVCVCLSITTVSPLRSIENIHHEPDLYCSTAASCVYVCQMAGKMMSVADVFDTESGWQCCPSW